MLSLATMNCFCISPGTSATSLGSRIVHTHIHTRNNPMHATLHLTTATMTVVATTYDYYFGFCYYCNCYRYYSTPPNNNKNNFLEKFYSANPIGITVEGSNTLTRNLIIFGQGLNKSHPYIYPLLESVLNDNLVGFKTEFKKLDHIPFEEIKPSHQDTLSHFGIKNWREFFSHRELFSLCR